MKVLWITNILFPEAEEKLSGKKDLRGSGGWMLASANMLTKQADMQLFVATVSSMVSKLEVIKGQRIIYCVLPFGKKTIKYKQEYEPYWRLISEQIQPDIVHIHGTELVHGLAYIRACGNSRVVISVQGLKSGIAPYYCAGLSMREIYGNLTFHDVIRGSIYGEQRAFRKSGELEKEMLCSVKHIIGRTSWDKAHVCAINPRANYYLCNETLRSEFYDGSTWSYDKCVPYSIFLSQAGYPLKGLHQVLKAMPLILRCYPNTTIRIAGVNITRNSGLGGILHFTGYGKIVKRLIKKYNLESRVFFLGPLNAEQMKTEYLRCNVFVCPSSIENSPNSLGEALLLGVPCCASYVGGIPDYMKSNEQYMYRFEEISMLARCVCKLFEIKDSHHNVSEDVLKKFDPETNNAQLISIYSRLLSKE